MTDEELIAQELQRLTERELPQAARDHTDLQRVAEYNHRAEETNMARPQAGQIERRTTGGCQLRAESDGSEMCLVGFAAMYNSSSKDLGGFTERISPNAFKRSIDAGDDVRCLFNHSPNVVLGRTKNGTLRFLPSSRGLKFRCQLDPNNQAHRDLHASIMRGDVDECSFAFTVPQGGDVWAEERGKVVRTLNDVNLMDVSAVTYPAYPGTNVGARAEARDYTVNDGTGDAERRAKAARLGAEIAASDGIPTTEELRARAARLGREIASGK